jgi:YtoQ family protein
MSEKTWKVYLSGEIHSDWRERIRDGAAAAGLPIRFDAPVTVHENSDDCGVAILGAEPNSFWHDHKGALLNSVRTRKLIEDADIVVVRFGEKYKQWNAAFDAGMAAALGKALMILHPAEHTHALKEVDAAAQVVAETPEQIVQALAYAIRGAMPERWHQKEAAE